MNLDQVLEQNQPQTILPPEPNVTTDDSFGSETQVIKEVLAPPTEPEDPFDEYVVGKVKQVTETILANCAEDRAKATEVIKEIEEIITKQGRIIQGGTISRLLQAVQTRADINSTAVKMMEACGKIMSARKGGAKTTITNTNQPTNSGNTLISILQEGLDKLGK